jgi:thiamine-phosphate pyrophosphorylase
MSRPLPILYGLTDPRGARGLTSAEAARLLLDAGVRWIQIRDKGLTSRAALDSARAAVGEVRRASATVILNDRADIALLSGADGVHLGEEDLPPAAARTVLPADAVVGASTHSPEAAWRAMDDEAVSYVALGPLFATATKDLSAAPLGLLALERTAARKTKPLVVIGGISPEAVGACLAAGADTVAMISGLLDGDTARNVERALESAERMGFRSP